MEGEFDVSSPQFNPDQAVAVLVKCRIVVLRNVFSITSNKMHNSNSRSNQFQQYVTDIDTGRISEEEQVGGTTSFGGDAHYILAEDDDRFNYMLTRDLVEQSPAVFANPPFVQRD